MDHRDRYHQLLAPDRRDRLLACIREQGFFECLKVSKAKIVDAGPLPYVFLEVEEDSRFVARGGGMLIDLSGVVEEPPAERYYLPYVGVTPSAGPDDIEHELEHLRALLDLIEAEPSYVVDAVRLGVGNLEDPARIEESVRFEVRKIFMLEVPAFARAFDGGCRSLDVPFVPGMNIEYTCETRSEYLQMWIGNYLELFRSMYVTRFPEHEAAIRVAMERATDEFGRDVAGAHPYKTIEATWDALPSRVLAQSGVLEQLGRPASVGRDSPAGELQEGTHVFSMGPVEVVCRVIRR